MRLDVADGAGRILETLEGATESQLVAVFERAERVGTTAWVAASIACGLLADRAAHGDQVLEKLAKRLGCHRAHAHRFVLAWKHVIRPLLERDRDVTVTPAPMAWAVTSAKLSRRLGRPALDLLADAARAIEIDSSLSIPRWRRQVLGEPDEPRADAGARRALKAIARLRAADLATIDPALVAAARRALALRAAA